VASSTLKDVNAQIKQIGGESADISVRGMKRLASETAHAGVFMSGAMTGAFSGVAGAFRGMLGVVLGGIEVMRGSMAAATFGISLIIGAAIAGIELLIHRHETLAKTAEEQAKKEKELAASMMDEVHKRQSEEETAAEKIKAIALATSKAKAEAMQNETNQKKALVEVEYQTTLAGISKERDALKKLFDDKIIIYDDYRDASNNLDKQESLAVQLRTNKIDEIERKSVMNRIKLALDIDKANDESRKKSHEKLVSSLKSDAEETDKSYKELEALQKKHDAELQAENAKMAAFMASAAEGIGAAMAAGIGKGSKSMKESMKAVLETTLSFVEKYVIAQEAAALAAGWWNPAVYAEIAITAGVLESAKAAIASFETRPGESKQVPGPYGMPQIAIVHGQEIISNPRGGSAGGITYQFLGPVLSPESLRQVLWMHSKRTGMPVQAVA
jgi:hypothetical protein